MGANDEAGDGLPPLVDSPSPMDSAPTVPTLPPGGGARSEPTALPSDLLPLPNVEADSQPLPDAPRNERRPPPDPTAPILPGTYRITSVYPLNGTRMFYDRLPIANGLDMTVIRGGVQLVTESPQFGVIDIQADSIIIWRKVDPKGKGIRVGPNGEQIEDSKTPMEMYLEGNVIVRQDERKVAGNGDQRTYRAKSAYYDLLTDRFIGLDAELSMFAPGLISPTRVNSPKIEQYRPLVPAPNGGFTLGLTQIRADHSVSTGSRFPNPGYQFNSRSIDVTRVPTTIKPFGGNKPPVTTDDPDAPPPDPNAPAPQDLTWLIDARQNVFWMGKVPVFYWPRFVTEADDLQSPVRQFGFSTNNYFGQQVLTDWNAFRLLNLRKPKNIDLWGIDIDYLSARTKTFPALGTELGWNGDDLINDLNDPYRQVRNPEPTWLKQYFGFLDVWGLRDYGNDILGSGPAIITNNVAAGKKGYQRGSPGVPAFQDFRGRFTMRHMQRFLPDDDEHTYEDLRAQIEVGAYTDRYFLEEYYKRLFDAGLDQETLAYVIRSKENWAYTLWTEGNTQPWQTETQWLPKLDYYRLGDSFLNDNFTYFQHSGIDYANVHTASEVNNRNIFAYMPYDPISNTSGSWSSGRAVTAHEVDLKLNLGDFFRLVPYTQGQLVGWTDQINGQEVGRAWGGAGVRAEAMAWKAYPWVENEYLNVHGLNHKINFEADLRDAWSNVRLNSLGVQDDLDDNTYETVRRYFALTNYAGGVLPAQYDPRNLILRRAISPITGTSDIQATMATLHLGLHQRLQTKRGPEGKRRIVDWMTFDVDTTYFPYASRDDFGKPFGQNMYNWQWFIGDRTSIVSYGWFEFWKITGNPIFNTNVDRHNDPFGLNMITTGININRPPRGSLFVGYTIVDTGPITTSALTTTINYWLSPKWYSTYSTMYDFGDAILLSASCSLTRIGADYLTSLSLNVDPQRQSYQFSVVVSPRLSPNAKLGGNGSSSSFDPRYAPTQ